MFGLEIDCIRFVPTDIAQLFQRPQMTVTSRPSSSIASPPAIRASTRVIAFHNGGLSDRIRPAPGPTARQERETDPPPREKELPQ
jgi:hypothetical protein